MRGRWPRTWASATHLTYQPVTLLVRTGAWILPDEHPLAAELTAFLDSGTPPVYAGFGSVLMRAAKDVARVAIEAIRAQGRRALLSRGWADLALIDDRDAWPSARSTSRHVSRSAARHGHQVRHAGPDALLRAMVASDLRLELMT